MSEFKGDHLKNESQNLRTEAIQGGTFASLDLRDFTGPLDLLDYLLRELKLPISEISVSRICDFYLEIIEKGQDSLDLALATEFLLLAAQLLQLKSRLLLPQQERAEAFEEDILQGDKLIFKLMAFRRNRLLAERIARRHPKYRYLFRSNEFNPELTGFEIKRPKLRLERESFENAIQLLQIQLAERFNLSQPGFRRILKLEPYSVKQKLCEIWSVIEDGREHSFEALLQNSDNLAEQLAAFLAILELLRRNMIKARQKNLHSEIYVMQEEGAEQLSLAEEEWKESGLDGD